MKTRLCTVWLILAAAVSANAAEPAENADAERRMQTVIDEVEKTCLEDTVYMIGRKKAERLAELVRQRKPRVVVECGTALGYSGLWIARELRAAGKGRLISIEISPRRAKQAAANFRKAGLEDLITIKVGDAREVVKQIDAPIDFVFIDCGSSNYYPCLKGLEKKLGGGTVIVADNAGISAGGMQDYLKHVRAKYQSSTEWFDIDLPWAKRDAMEITVIPR